MRQINRRRSTNIVTISVSSSQVSLVFCRVVSPPTPPTHPPHPTPPSCESRSQLTPCHLSSHQLLVIVSGTFFVFSNKYHLQRTTLGFSAPVTVVVPLYVCMSSGTCNRCCAAASLTRAFDAIVARSERSHQTVCGMIWLPLLLT